MLVVSEHFGDLTTPLPVVLIGLRRLLKKASLIDLAGMCAERSGALRLNTSTQPPTLRTMIGANDWGQ